MIQIHFHAFLFRLAKVHSFADAGVDNGAFDRGNGSSKTDDEASLTTRASGWSNCHDVVAGTLCR